MNKYTNTLLIFFFYFSYVFLWGTISETSYGKGKV